MSAVNYHITNELSNKVVGIGYDDQATPQHLIWALLEAGWIERPTVGDYFLVISRSQWLLALDKTFAEQEVGDGAELSLRLRVCGCPG